MKNRNLPLIVGISLPIIFIIIISAVVFIPTLFINPQYNFLYSSTNNYSYNSVYSHSYSVVNNRLALISMPTSTRSTYYTYKDENPPLYMYDVKNNSSHQVDYSQAKDYVLDASPSSPDGYNVKYDYNNAGIFDMFGGGSYGGGYVIFKNSASKKLTGLSSADGNNFYYGTITILGWIK